LGNVVNSQQLKQLQESQISNQVKFAFADAMAEWDFPETCLFETREGGKKHPPNPRL